MTNHADDGCNEETREASGLALGRRFSAYSVAQRALNRCSFNDTNFNRLAAPWCSKKTDRITSERDGQWLSQLDEQVMHRTSIEQKKNTKRSRLLTRRLLLSNLMQSLSTASQWSMLPIEPRWQTSIGVVTKQCHRVIGHSAKNCSRSITSLGMIFKMRSF